MILTVMPHPLAFLKNFIKDADPSSVELSVENKVSNLGKPFEILIKDLLAGTRGLDESKKNNIWNSVIPFQGAERNPPDLMTIYMGADVKKMESYSNFSRNSSDLERFLNPENEKYKDKLKKIAKPICEDFFSRHGFSLPFYYFIVNVDKKTHHVAHIYVTDGECIEESVDGIRPVIQAGMEVADVYENGSPRDKEDLERMGLAEPAKKIIELAKIGKYAKSTNELGVYETHDGSRQRARQMGLSKHPAHTHKLVLPPRVRKRKNKYYADPTTRNIALSVILTKKHYMSMPEDYRKEVENSYLTDESCRLSFKEFLYRDSECILIHCERKIPLR